MIINKSHYNVFDKVTGINLILNPSVTYGCHIIPITKNDLKEIKSIKKAIITKELKCSKCIKNQILYNSKLKDGLDIKSIQNTIDINRINSSKVQPL